MGKQSAGLGRAAYARSVIKVITWISNVKASSLPVASCLGHPYDVPVYMHICVELGKQTAGLGRAA